MTLSTARCRLVLACLLLVALPSSVWAGGPPELLTQILVQPTDPSRMVLRFENAGDGLLFSDDGGESWRALCPDAMKPVDVPVLRGLGPLGLAGDGTLFVGMFDNALRDDGTGCAFATEPAFVGEWVAAFANHPSDPNVLFAITSTAPDGQNGVFKRTGDSSWEAVGALEDIMLWSLQVAELPSGALRFYQTASRGTLGMAAENRPNFMVRVSDDLGATWTEHPYDVGVGSGTPRFRVEAVDATQPDRIVVSVHRVLEESRGDVLDEVLVSDDQGASFTSYAKLTQFGGLDMASDGRIWIGDLGDPFDGDKPFGLHAAASLDDSPTVLDDSFEVSCVRYLPDRDEVFACSRITAGNVAADGSGYTQTFSFADVGTHVDCPGQDTVELCRQSHLRYWCTAAHFNSAPLCCPYVQADGRLAGVVPENLDCSAWNAMQSDPVALDSGAGDPAADSGSSDVDASGPPIMGPEPEAGPRRDASEAGAGSKSSDGCGCVVPGGPRSGGSKLLLTWLLCIGMLASRVRRRSTKRAR